MLPTETPCILTVHAHPDDEASKGAPTLAMYGRRGVRTVLVCCTGGEEGDLQNPSLRDPGQPFHGLTASEEKVKLAELRPLELARSAEVIGFSDVEMLGYRDSGMADSPSNQHPDCFHMAPTDDAVDRLAVLIRRHRPQIVITYGEDQQGYPHPDHLKVHDITGPAVERAADDAFVSGDSPWQVSKIYWSAWSKARLVAMHEALIELRGSSPFDQAWLDRPGHDHLITTRIRIGDHLWARSGALRAHATQVDPNEPWWFGLSDDELAEAYPYDDFILARSFVDLPPRDGYETDLFEGLDVGSVR